MQRSVSFVTLLVRCERFDTERPLSNTALVPSNADQHRLRSNFNKNLSNQFPSLDPEPSTSTKWFHYEKLFSTKIHEKPTGSSLFVWIHFRGGSSFTLFFLLHPFFVLSTALIYFREWHNMLAPLPSFRSNIGSKTNAFVKCYLNQS